MTVTQETAPQRPGSQGVGTQAHTDSAEAFVPSTTRRRRVPTVGGGAAP